VFANLLGNAAKYTEPGGHVEVKASRHGAEVVVSVRDDGSGIEAEIQPRLFDLFVQGNRPLDRSQGGLGIGLTVARTLVELHGGCIVVTSQGPGTGSEFVVRLPALEQPAALQGVAAAPSSELPRGKRGGGARILIVDDNVDAADVLGEALRAFGHEVAVAHDGPQALEVAAAFHPHAAILDIGLPQMDGFELAVRLREQHPGPLRLIALSGYGQDRDKARSQRAGFEAHLVKPVDLDALGALFAASAVSAA
jgi:CheY-like chemotaxis protein